MHIWLSSNVFFTKLVVRIGQMSTKSLRFATASTLHYGIDLLSSLISLASTLILYELSNSWLVALRLLYPSLLLLATAITTTANQWT
jgi:hypothetical protein